ncbi:hypothetical protein SAY86_011469 [Trapa natans]|uniref:AT-hook motif nuclear-localized protein n=1 Tax=Trapa natans TaxID=22666 RepID=A0AAN7R559_TRANT|nr:hypothetical protein SAY86_011469 [Trapa natans]
MDRTDTMGGPYYSTHRGISGTQPLNAASMQFQSNYGSGSLASTLQPDPPSPGGFCALTAIPTAPAEPLKRKRGRPRKYGSDGSFSLALSSASISPYAPLGHPQKRGRGRPLGSGRKQQLASSGEWISGSAGTGFTPHIITVAAGEDISTKIMAFAQQGSRAICILSAMGSVSTVSLRQASNSGGYVTYEGCFEILCLSGSYLLTDNSGSPHRSGGLSISLASPDGRVIGGGVGGMLIAARPVQVILGSFFLGRSKAKNKKGDGSQGAAIQDDMIGNQISTTINQNLTQPSLGTWRYSQPSNMEDIHSDIDLMRRVHRVLFSARACACACTHSVKRHQNPCLSASWRMSYNLLPQVTSGSIVPVRKASADRDLALAEVEKEKKASFIRAWEDGEKAKAENK